MARDRGGIGRTGSKAKNAAQKRARAAAAEAKSASTAPAADGDAAATQKEQEQQAAVAAVSPGTALKEKNKSRRIRKVRFAGKIKREKGPLSGGTWGGRWDRTTEVIRETRKWERLGLDYNGRDEDRAKHELLAHLWGLRVEEHVAKGCPRGDWSNSYAEEVPWLLHSSHRNWCPRGLPDPEWAVGRWCDIHRMPYKCQSLRDAEA